MYLDANGDKNVTKEEAKGQIDKHCKENPDDDLCPKNEEDWADLTALFGALDTDNDNGVTPAEAEAFYEENCGLIPSGEKHGE